MPTKLNIALLTHTATALGHQLLEGVVRYAKKQERWRILHEHGRGTREVLRLPMEWKADGIITRILDSQLAEHVKERDVPVINLSSICIDESTEFPRVCEDVIGVGTMAANHFVDLGFKHFGYYGSFRYGLYASVRDAFEKVIKEKRETFSCHPTLEERIGSRKRNRNTVGLKEWIESLPKPVGIFTWGPQSATELIGVCRDLGILIPEQIAILVVGAANDATLDILEPSVSNVVINGVEIGYQAAQLLDEMMWQKRQNGPVLPSPEACPESPIPMRSIFVPPLGVEVRQSTDTLAIANEHVAQAISYIRNHALKPITVADVLSHVSISRPRIEILFRQYLKRSPAEEIRRIRLSRAEELLRETNLSIPEVAKASGFTSPEYLARVFKATKGVTPLRYRKN